MSNAFEWTPSARPVGKRLNQFAEYINRIHLGWELDTYQSHTFDATVRGCSLGDISVTDVIVDPVSGRRRKQEIAQASSEHYVFICILEGEEQLTQGSNEATLQPGDSTVWHTSRPATFASSCRTRQLSIFVPNHLVERRSPNLMDLCCKRMDGATGFGALLGNYFKTLPSIYQDINETSGIHLIDPVLEMLNGALTNQDDIYDSSTSTRKLVHRIHSHIIENIEDSELSPSDIASRFGISPRYLHKLFNGLGFTVSGFIRNQRLMRAKVELAKPTLKKLSITEVAYRCGFNDASHFGKLFKQEFGVRPSDFKGTALKKVALGSAG